MNLQLPPTYKRQRCDLNDFKDLRIEALERENKKLREKLNQLKER